jgi:UDP-N-acetyl-D-mannosaminuronic acid dehydrogenase
VTSVAVVGLGRVGLPLALSFADRGHEVIGVERETAVVEAVEGGQMPFEETGTQELLLRVRERGGLELTSRVQDAARANHIVLTLGTPSHIHIEIDMSQIRRAIDDLLPVLREGQSLILRSTVAPGTTDWVAGYIEQRRGFRVGEDLFVAHVPERIAENHFLEEIATLPCIVGASARGRAPRRPSCSSPSGPRSCRPVPSRPSWPRSGPTSCATRSSRSPIS